MVNAIFVPVSAVQVISTTNLSKMSRPLIFMLIIGFLKKRKKQPARTKPCFKY